MISKRGIQEALDKFEQLKVVVVGDMMLDRYIWGKINRISPEAPVPVVEMTHELDRPGGAGNVVLNLTSLGAKCTPVSILGNDRSGAALKEQLSSGNADISKIVFMEGRPTTIKTRIIADNQHVVRVDREVIEEFPSDLIQQLTEKFKEAVKGADAVILQDYNKGVLSRTVIRETIDLANEAGIPVMVDPKFHNFFDYWGATVFKPNIRETEQALNRSLARDADIERVGNELLTRLRTKHVLITRGQNGMSLFTDHESPVHIPTQAVTIHDVSGAGDTVIATLSLAMAAGLDAVESTKLSTLAAKYVVGQIGIVPVTREALLQMGSD